MASSGLKATGLSSQSLVKILHSFGAIRLEVLLRSTLAARAHTAFRSASLLSSR
jgi:hypothetical protein